MNHTHYWLLLRRIGLLMLLYTLCRIIFYLVNWGQYEGITVAELAIAFLQGFLFDIAAILFINLPVTLLSLLPFEFVGRYAYQSKLAILFQLLNIPFLVLNVINAGYFQLSGQRLRPADHSGVEKVAFEQIWYLLVEYWYVSVLALLMILLIVWYDPSYKQVKGKGTVSPIWGTLVLIMALLASILIFAFVLRNQPLPPGEILVTRASYLENLSRNASFNFLAEIFQRVIDQVD